MDVLLGMLPDRVTVGSGSLRCARAGQDRRSALSVRIADGSDCPYSIELICRVSAAPAVGAVVTCGTVTGVVSAVTVVASPGPWMRHARIYVTTRTDITGPLPDSVQVFPSVVAVDAYGTRVRVPSTVGVTLWARLDDVSSTETHQDGQRRAQTWRLTVDTDLGALGVDAYSTVVDDDEGVWAIEGDPVAHTDPTGRVWSTAALRRTGDGMS